MKPARYAAVLMLLVSSAMASADPFVGKWVLNPGRSKYPPGTCPRRMVIEMQSAGQGIHYRSETTYSDGITAHSEYTANYGGRQVLVVGDRGLLLPVSLKRADSHTVIASYMRGLQVVATSRRVVSRAGKRMTITTVAKDPSGKSVTYIGAYEKAR